MKHAQRHFGNHIRLSNNTVRMSEGMFKREVNLKEKLI